MPRPRDSLDQLRAHRRERLDPLRLGREFRYDPNWMVEPVLNGRQPRRVARRVAPAPVAGAVRVVLEQAVDNEGVDGHASVVETGEEPCGLCGRQSFGREYDPEASAARIAQEGADRRHSLAEVGHLVAVAIRSPVRRRSEHHASGRAGAPADTLADLAGDPECLAQHRGEIEQSERVAGGGSVENDEVVVVDVAREVFERRHLVAAGHEAGLEQTFEVVLVEPKTGVTERIDERLDDPAVRRLAALRVDFGGVERVGYRPRLTAQGAVEDVAERVGGVRRDNERSFLGRTLGVSERVGRRTGCLANAALAAVGDDARRLGVGHIGQKRSEHHKRAARFPDVDRSSGGRDRNRWTPRRRERRVSLLEKDRPLGRRLFGVQESTRGTLMVFAAAAGFGTIGVFGEVAASIDLALSTLLPVRFTLATAAVCAVAAARGWSLPEARRDRLAALGLGVVYTLMTLAFFVSLRYLTAGLATVVLYTYPAMLVLLSAAALDEPVTPRKAAALCLATVGVGLVAWTGTAGADPVGIALALGSAACYAAYTAGSRYVVPRATPEGVMLGVLVGTTLSMALYGVVDGGLAGPAGADQWGVVLGIAVVSTVAPHLLFYEGISRLEAGRVGVVSTVEPVVAVVLGAALLGERVTAVVVAGGALVLGGVVLVHRGPRGGAPVSRD